MKRATLLVWLLLAVGVAAQAAPPTKQEKLAQQKLVRTFDHIRCMYVEPVDMEALAERAIGAMLRELDPYSGYLPADWQEQFVEAITQPSIAEARMLDATTGYIRVSHFGQTTVQEFYRAYVQLGLAETSSGSEKPGGKPVGRLILDLRGNGGGIFASAVGLAEFFLPKGATIVSTEGRGVPTTVYKAGKEPVFPATGQLVVLIDEHSASASEVVAGALQDNGRALMVGRRSYGKGLVQRQYPLGDGSVLRLTVARYHTPSGRVLEGEGITPDVETTPEEDLPRAIELLR